MASGPSASGQLIERDWRVEMSRLFADRRKVAMNSKRVGLDSLHVFRFLKPAVLILLVAHLGSFALPAATNLTYAGQTQAGDEQRRFLEVRRRQIELQTARQELKRKEELFNGGLVSQADIDKARMELSKAQLGYQEAVLSLISLEPRISVRRAVKHQKADGRKFVRLTIANLTPAFDDSQFRILSNFDGADPLPEELRKRDLQDVFISLKDPGEQQGATGAAAEMVARGTNISLPYEEHISKLRYGEESTLEFQLLRDVSSVIVVVSFKGQSLEQVIQLQHAEGDSTVAVSSMQFSQEADLGGQVTYDLRLERSSVDVRNFQLKAVNLPRQISYSFIDPNTQARLSQINFPAGVTEQKLGLKLFLPERADEDARIDQPLEFWALVMDQAQAQKFHDDATYSVAGIEQSRAGRVRLVVVPRGVGRIEVSAASLFSEILVGQIVETNITVRNTGTRRLDNVRLSSDYPLNWRAEFEPDIIPALDLNREAVVRLKVLPPLDVPVGDYEVRIKTESYADGRRVQSEDKIYRASIKARTNLWVTFGLVGGLFMLIVAIVVFGVRLTKR